MLRPVPPALLVLSVLAIGLLAPGTPDLVRAEEEEADPLAGFERAPDPAEAPGPDADLFREGVLLQEKGSYARARRKLWKLIDEHPDSPFRPEAEDRSGPNAFLGYTRMHAARPSERRIDVALMGDGYLFDRQDRFNKAAAGHLKVLLKEPTFAAYEPYFCFWRFNLASRDTGVDEVERVPADEEQAERERRRRKKRKVKVYSTALDCKAAGPQGQVMANPRRVWHYLSYLPENDGLAVVFAKMGRLGMGGMGIATTGPKGVVVHEFGHAFSGLLDEYANNPGEPFGAVESANTTTNRQNPPWKHFLEARVPGVGVYEGAATYKKGVYRPAPSCAMNTGGNRYCPVCREATVLMIYTYVSPIDVVAPADREVTLTEDGWPAFRVQPMRPMTHRLDVRFFLGDAPPATGKEAEEKEDSAEDRFADDMLTEAERKIWERIKERRAREGRTTPLPQLIHKEGLVRRSTGTAHEKAPPGREVKSRRRKGPGGVRAEEAVLPDLPPGRHLLTAVVQDPAKPRGERVPWVLKDPRGLLQDRHTWVLVVPEPQEVEPPRR